MAYAACLLAITSVEASSLPPLRLPVVCEDPYPCIIQNYFDHDPGPGFLDYSCGSLGYDGHDGTDIRLPNLTAMKRGAAVVAAAPGTVRAIRDEMPDVNVRVLGREAIAGREAGNAVVLRHGDDWETQYSHLRLGSVRVRPGGVVKAGDVLGVIGLSGNTEFPHLHFEVRYQGEPVDPFVGPKKEISCGASGSALWDEQTSQALSYRSTGLLQAGFGVAVPSSESVAAGNGNPGPFSPDAPALVFWVEIFGARAGDQENLRLIEPGGKEIASKKALIPKNKARWLSFAGKKRRSVAWPKGLYSATYELQRAGDRGTEAVVDVMRTIEIK
jgi:murein DD-endopeptidase MepM/ murein hydrolase activator NlpD